MISVSQLEPLGRLEKHSLQKSVCQLLERLFNLSGKFADEEKIFQFGESLTKQLPAIYGNLSIKDVETIFDNAIRGDYGELKTISLPVIFQWFRSYANQGITGTGVFAKKIENIDYEGYHVIDWSQQVYLAYQKYLTQGLKLGEISRYLYDRMMLDNWIEVDAYKAKLDKAKQMLPDGDETEQIFAAQKMIVINKFEELKREGRQEIYGQYK